MSGPETRKLPETLERVNRELRKLRDAGLSDEIVDFDMTALLDDDKGPFGRLTFTLADGGKLTLDSLEFSDILRRIYGH